MSSLKKPKNVIAYPNEFQVSIKEVSGIEYARTILNWPAEECVSLWRIIGNDDSLGYDFQMVKLGARHLGHFEYRTDVIRSAFLHFYGVRSHPDSAENFFIQKELNQWGISIYTETELADDEAHFQSLKNSGPNHGNLDTVTYPKDCTAFINLMLLRAELQPITGDSVSPVENEAEPEVTVTE